MRAKTITTKRNKKSAKSFSVHRLHSGQKKSLDPPSLEELPEMTMPQEAQAFLRLGRSKFYQLLHSGELQSVRFGRTYRIPRAVLARFIAA
jgi:excisionase family DNA binding protein